MIITPEDWGPKLWITIHIIAMSYPRKPSDIHKQQYKNYFLSLQHILPCSICANNYKRHLEEDLPLTDDALSNNETLLKWTIDLHNLVNKEKGKRQYTHKEAEQLILKNIKKDCYNDEDNKKMTILGLMCAFALLVGIAIIYKKSN